MRCLRALGWGAGRHDQAAEADAPRHGRVAAGAALRDPEHRREVRPQHPDVPLQSPQLAADDRFGGGALRRHPRRARRRHAHRLLQPDLAAGGRRRHRHPLPHRREGRPHREAAAEHQARRFRPDEGHGRREARATAHATVLVPQRPAVETTQPPCRWHGRCASAADLAGLLQEPRHGRGGRRRCAPVRPREGHQDRLRSRDRRRSRVHGRDREPRGAIPRPHTALRGPQPPAAGLDAGHRVRGPGHHPPEAVVPAGR
mmetsp:Transcript_63205/g.203735  ORF Transcript_63205/g.203735 Transcript_63205/m.203735 type:complete len:258 (+) Transcript_63205:2139-2912(+)